MIATGKHLHFDCASGCAGDMTLGALIDLGVPEEVVVDAVARLGLGRDRLRIARVVKGGVAAVDLTVRTDDAGHHAHHGHGNHEHGHHEHGDHEHGDHEHDHHHHHYAGIRRRVEAAGLAAEVVARALDIFDRIAAAEARLHGTTPLEVAFHEVGAIDSIADVVGSAAALAHLAPASVSASPVAMGHGTVRCAHGILPVPSPAALEILRAAGAPMTDGGLGRELCTPTGAAILAHAVTDWGPLPTSTPLAIGYGAGDADLADRPNVLRAVLAEPAARGGAAALYRVEANLDDMSAELCAHVADALFAAGAVDVWWTPVTMKKSRPAVQLSALVGAAARDRVLEIVLRETTTLGVRFDEVERRVLDREQASVDTPYGAVEIKLARLEGELVNAAPEYESCRRAAIAHGVALKQVYAAAVAAWERRAAGA